MMRSPSSASAISSARSCSGGMTSASTGSLRVGVHQGRAAGELRQLAHEVPWPMDANRFFIIELVVLCDRDAASKHDHEAGGDFAGSPEPLTASKRAHLAKLTHPLDFRRIEGGIHLIAPLFANRLHCNAPHANGFDDKLRLSYAKSRVKRSLQTAAIA